MLRHMETTNFGFLREEDDIEKVNSLLDSGGYRILEIKKRRISSDPSEPDFHDKLTYVLGFSWELQQEDNEPFEEGEEPGTEDMQKIMAPPPAPPTAPSSQDVPF